MHFPCHVLDTCYTACELSCQTLNHGLLLLRHLKHVFKGGMAQADELGVRHDQRLHHLHPSLHGSIQTMLVVLHMAFACCQQVGELIDGGT